MADAAVCRAPLFARERKKCEGFSQGVPFFLTMKLNLILPFVAICLACTATGEQPTPAAAEVQEALQKRRLGDLKQSEPAAGQPPRRETRLFVFPGGTPAEYLAAVDKEMGS